MNTDQFLHSVVLLILGQIPLVVKLWLDHRSKIEPYRKEFFARQAVMFLELYIAVTDLHWALFRNISLYPIDEGSSEHREFVEEIRKGLGKSYSEWSAVLRKSELLLPAQMVRATWDYHVLSAKISAAAAGVRSLQEDDVGRMWKDQTLLYNQIVNEMRVRLGVDTLSGQLLTLVEEKRKQLVVAEFHADHLETRRERHRPA